MANSTVVHKNTGDQFTADELNNIVTSLNSKRDLGAPVTFSAQQVFNFNASDLVNFSSPATFLFWAVMDELPGYNNADKSTWTFKAIAANPQFTTDAVGNIASYTIDLGYAPVHGMYQIQ